MSTPLPPKWPLRLLRFLIRDEYLEEIEGDMEELFQENLATCSARKARNLYRLETLKLIRPILLKKITSNHPTIPYDMFRHNLKITFRNFLRHKPSFFINLTGLATGLACFLLIYLWVQDEWRMDQFHEHDQRLYQVLENRKGQEGITTVTNTSGPTGAALAADMPEVEIAVTARTKSINDQTLSADDINIRGGGLYASKDFFRVFSFELIDGTPRQALAGQNMVVISESLAERLFGRTDRVVGETLELEHEQLLQVGGVFKDLPRYSSLQFDFVLSYEAWSEENTWVNSWRGSHPQTFLLMQPGTDIEQFNAKIADYLAVKTEGEEINRTLFAVPYSRQYLYGNYENGQQSGGRIEYVRLFSLVALFILLIACINFMNLSTARANERSKEVGVKKTIGAGRLSLMFQYLSESTLLAVMGLIGALVLVVVFLPQFNIITGKQLRLAFDLPLAGVLLGSALFTGLLAGSYPAIYLSGLNPMKIIKGSNIKSGGALWLRKSLVVLQFSLSVILMAGVWVVYKQIAYTQNQHLGYDRDNVILFSREGKLRDYENTQVFLEEAQRIPGISKAAIMDNTMTESDWTTNGLNWPGKDPEDQTVFDIIQVDYGALELLGLEMQSGRPFSQAYGGDSTSLIFNETAIRHMGLTEPVGQHLHTWGEDLEIIGVVKDFHLESFHKSIKPAIFYLGQNGRYIMLKLDGKRTDQAIDALRTSYQTANPGFSLDYTFLDDNYAALYAAEQRVSSLSRYFAGLAVLISCLGLFGLALFTAARRQKELGIRKILGASPFQLVRLLSDDFTRTVGLAILLALPISYLLTESWLETFAFRITLEWWYFPAIGLLALMIAWLTVGIQSLHASRINPVECLRNE
ncbi:MAG: ABC transporter permease [Saprospiraceae bacterium]|nr:ABC transporter permease [Lewinella sp.]